MHLWRAAPRAAEAVPRRPRARPDQMDSFGRDALKFKELEHVLIEKVEQLFRDMLYWRSSGRARAGFPWHCDTLGRKKESRPET